MTKIDLETLKALKDVMQPQQTVVADRDSFETFTKGLRENWIFVMAAFAVGFWGITQILNINNENDRQREDISQNAAAVTALTDNLNSFKEEIRSQFADSATANQEIIRRLDLVQKDIEVIKSTR